MKLAYLTELAALISAHGQVLIQQPQPLSNATLGDFYIQSRNRFNRWLRDLNDLEEGGEIRDPMHLIGLNPLRPAVQSITEQILINDILNRVWTVVTISADRYRGEDRLETMVRNVFRGYLAIRDKALSLCLNDKSLSVAQVNHVTKLQRSAERWSDLLCCIPMGTFDLWDYAYDKDRAQQYYQDQLDPQTMKPRDHAWTLILAGLHHSFPEEAGLAAPLHDEDRQITRAMLNAFPGGTRNLTIWSGETPAQVESQAPGS